MVMLSSAATARRAACAAAMDAGMSDLERTSASATLAPLSAAGASTAATAATTGEDDDTACGAVVVAVEAAERERGEGGGDEERPERAAPAPAAARIDAPEGRRRVRARPSLSVAAREAAPRGRGVANSARIGVLGDSKKRERDCPTSLRETSRKHAKKQGNSERLALVSRR